MSLLPPLYLHVPKSKLLEGPIFKIASGPPDSLRRPWYQCMTFLWFGGITYVFQYKFMRTTLYYGDLIYFSFIIKLIFWIIDVFIVLIIIYVIYTIYKENTWFWADLFTSNYTLTKKISTRILFFGIIQKNKNLFYICYIVFFTNICYIIGKK